MNNLSLKNSVKCEAEGCTTRMSGKNIPKFCPEHNYLNARKQEPSKLDYEATRMIFKPCPFCGNDVSVFQVPETRYGPLSKFGWTIECMNMGCIFSRPSPDQSLKHLADEWNKRV